MNNFSELKYRFNYASPTLKLIFINAGVFIFALLGSLSCILFMKYYIILFLSSLSRFLSSLVFLLINLRTLSSLYFDIDYKNIFTKGFRGKLSSERNTYGKGYGLYLCKLILGDVNGDLKVNKINNNVKFTITL